MAVIVCPICCDAFKEVDEIYSTSCGHVYHYQCMQKWKSRSTSCPQCRQYNPDSHKLFLTFDDSNKVEENLRFKFQPKFNGDYTELRSELLLKDGILASINLELQQTRKKSKELSELLTKNIAELNEIKLQSKGNPNKRYVIREHPPHEFDDLIIQGKSYNSKYTVIIKRLTHVNSDNASDRIVELAAQMGIDMYISHIKNISILGPRRSNLKTLVVEFYDHKLKLDFMANKDCLKWQSDVRNVKIEEPDTLYQHATQLRKLGYKVYREDDQILVKSIAGEYAEITTFQDVDDITNCGITTSPLYLDFPW